MNAKRRLLTGFVVVGLIGAMAAPSMAAKNSGTTIRLREAAAADRSALTGNVRLVDANGMFHLEGYDLVDVSMSAFRVKTVTSWVGDPEEDPFPGTAREQIEASIPAATWLYEWPTVIIDPLPEDELTVGSTNVATYTGVMDGVLLKVSPYKVKAPAAQLSATVGIEVTVSQNNLGTTVTGTLTIAGFAPIELSGAVVR